MTFSIIARCARTGRLGVGTATFSIACGRRNESVRPGAGISKSQAFYNRAVDPLALNLLAQGFSPLHALRTLGSNDADFEYRQLGILDRHGNVVAHTGVNCGKWAGHTVGAGYAAYGNGLAGPHVLEGIVNGFASNPDDDLEFRLLRAIEGGRDSGGQAANGVRRPERSAWIRVVDSLDCPEVDLRVDLHESAVHAMRDLLDEFARRRGYYGQCANDPAHAPEEPAFAACAGC